MKKILNSILAVSFASSALVALPQVAQAELSANFGGVTNYVYRGVQQTGGNDNPQWQGGVDYSTENGFYAGAWGSTLFNLYGDSEISEGIEYDLYAGWSGNITEDFGIGLGVLTYNYTDKDAIDDGDKFTTLAEIGLSANYGMLSANYDIGKDNFSATESDYVHYAISADVSAIDDGMGLTYGATKYDGLDAYEYLDIGYNGNLQGFDFNANAIFSGDKLGDDFFIVLGLTKTFLID